jgi:GMP synthase (glutamine-hydrolysing)
MPRRKRAARPLADADPARKHDRFLVCARIASTCARVITVKWGHKHESVAVAWDDQWRGLVRVLTIVHQDNCGPGVFADAAAEMGAELVGWRIAEGGALPSGRYDAVLALGGAPLPDAPDGFILEEVDVLRRSVAGGVPVLGICLGAEVLARALGAGVAPVQHREYGWHDIELDAAVPFDPILGGLPAARVTAFMAHWYGFDLPAGAVQLARTPTSLHAFRYGDRVWGLLFHPEVTEDDIYDWMRKRLAAGDGIVPTSFRDTPASEVIERTPSEIGRWNDAGRTIFRRFLDVVKACPSDERAGSDALTRTARAEATPR